MQTTFDIDSPEFWIAHWERSRRSATAFSGYGSATTWNAMARCYGTQSRADRKRDQVRKTIALLEQKGICLDGARVLDIGCGPGQYAEAFARRGAEVVCIDVARKMIDRLKQETDPTLRKRLTPVVADWSTLDLQSAGFARAFDLVFANMTPAVSGPASFLKIPQAAKRWCWFRGWAGPREDPLLEGLHQAVFNRPAESFRGNFLDAYNLVCAWGYFPDCAFEPVHWTRKRPLPECIEFYKTFFNVHPDVSETSTEKITSYLNARAADGFVESTTTGHIGSMVWTLDDNTGDRL